MLATASRILDHVLDTYSSYPTRKDLNEIVDAEIDQIHENVLNLKQVELGCDSHSILESIQDTWNCLQEMTKNRKKDDFKVTSDDVFRAALDSGIPAQ